MDVMNSTKTWSQSLHSSSALNEVNRAYSLLLSSICHIIHATEAMIKIENELNDQKNGGEGWAFEDLVKKYSTNLKNEIERLIGITKTKNKSLFTQIAIALMRSSFLLCNVIALASHYNYINNIVLGGGGAINLMNAPADLLSKKFLEVHHCSVVRFPPLPLYSLPPYTSPLSFLPFLLFYLIIYFH